MSATESDATAADGPQPAATPTLTLVPLQPALLTPAVTKLLSGANPAKLMAAKGLAPLRPADLALALYQLTFDAEPTVKAAAEASPGALSDRVLLPMLGEALPPAVLHFLATRLPVTKVDALEKVLYNQATADETFVALATRLSERELEVICQNEARLLRCPAIVSALFCNAAARMSSVNRAVELCARNGVRVDGIPAFDEVAQAVVADALATAPAADQSFSAAIAEAAAAAELDPAPVAAEEPSAGATADEPRSKRKSAVIDFSRLKLYEKIRLAMLGNAYCRQNLVRDSNKVVAMAAVRSPLIGDSEIVAMSASKQICEDVIRYLANSREHTKHYAVKYNLATNPKCPLALSLRFLPLLRAEDVKKIAQSKNVPTAMSTAARRLVASRPGR